MSMAVAADGHGAFTEDDRPGGDSSAHNGIVRTADSVVYSVDISPGSGRPARDETFVVNAPPGTSWSRIPSACNGPGSGIAGSALTCNLGDVSAVTRVSVVLDVGRLVKNRDELVPSGSVRAAQAPEVAAIPPAPVRVSAAPRYDLSISAIPPSISNAESPDGKSPGKRLVYPILVDWKGIHVADGLLGYEQLRGDITFSDDVSKMYGDAASPALLSPLDGAPACGINTGQVPQAPGGRGGGPNAVADSGTITCSQNEPGGPISVTVSGIDSRLDNIPSKSVSGGAIPGGVRPYIVAGYLSLWVPEPVAVDTLTAVNRYTDLAAPSVTGQKNYDGETEPLGNNAISRNIGRLPGVSGNLRYWGVANRPDDLFVLSGKYDEPYTTLQQSVRTTATLVNAGAETWSGSLVCSVFDNRVQKLNDDTSGVFASSSAPSVTGRPQFAVFRGTPDEARDYTCSDSDATWYDDARDVPGGPESVGAVRYSFDFPAARTLSFHTSLQVEPRLPNYTPVRSYVSIRPGADGAWVHDKASGALANGTWADFLTVTGDLARIRSKIVDPGHDVGDTPDETEYVEQGNTFDLALYPTLTNATTGGKASTVSIVDTLPAGMAYVDGSASPTPDSVSNVTAEDGTVHQVLRWKFESRQPNDDLPILSFTIRAVSVSTAGTVTNHAVIESTNDISNEARRSASRGVHVLPTGALAASETARRPGVVVGDTLEWTLRYDNNADTDFASTDLISVFPHDEDDRGTTLDSVRLSSPVAVETGETVRYTAAVPSSVSSDPAESSNAEGGSTRWCLEAQFGRNGCPEAIRDATAVRIERTATVEAGSSVEHVLLMSSAAADDADRAGSSFTVRASDLTFAAASNTAIIELHSGSIGHRVWFDANANGVQDAGEHGLDGVAIKLTGTDDRGRPVSRTTVSDVDGQYAFSRLRPGAYTVNFGRAANGWTVRNGGADPTTDSDVDAQGTAPAELTAAGDEHDITAVSSQLHIDAGALPAPDPVTGPGVDPEITPPPLSGEATKERPSAADESAFPRLLAFTGSETPLWVTAGALLAVLVGVIVVVTRRRRHRGE
jgi:hypothetical protein